MLLRERAGRVAAGPQAGPGTVGRAGDAGSTEGEGGAGGEHMASSLQAVLCVF